MTPSAAARPEALPPLSTTACAVPTAFSDFRMSVSRVPGAPKCYVQDLIAARGDEVAALLADARTHVYVCGLKGMEAGVLDALRAACAARGMDWDALLPTLRDEGRLHIETY